MSRNGSWVGARRLGLPGVDNPFDAATSSYARVRPTYPGRALDLVLASPTRVVRDVVDLGAGTGRMSLALARRGLRVRAVEPAAAMRAQLLGALARNPGEGAGRVQVVDAGAEATGLPARGADLVVSAQAWHWFDGEAAGAEAARLLRPGGALAIVFNQMDVSLPWIHRLTRIMRSGDVHRVDAPPRVGPLLEEPRVEVVRWVEETSPEDLLELATTRSSYLRSDVDNRRRMQDNLRWYLYEHRGLTRGQRVEVPYLTLVWTTRILP